MSISDQDSPEFASMRVSPKCGKDAAGKMVPNSGLSKKGARKRSACAQFAANVVLMAWSVDRLGRSLQDLCGFLSELHSLGIDLFLHQQGIDTTTPAGKAMFQMMGVFAEFERSMIRERVNAGIARAKAAGKHCGRPFIDTKLEGRIRHALAVHGRPGLHKIAKQFGVGTGTVQRIAHD
jgi:DNA invertase Pin-like site-specific DNA recombinase